MFERHCCLPGPRSRRNDLAGYVQATVDVDSLGGNEARPIRTEVGDGLTNFLWPTKALQRSLGDQLGPLLFEQRLHERRINNARRNRVDFEPLAPIPAPTCGRR